MAATGNRSATITLPTDEQILIVRGFDAPKHRVYKAWTTPELVRRWWSGRRGEMKVVEIDLRVGGRWRYVMEAEGGFEVGFHGEYREIVANERLVTTESTRARRRRTSPSPTRRSTSSLSRRRRAARRSLSSSSAAARSSAT